MPLLATDAIVLHVADYLESSLIVRMATRDGGVRAAVARGARRSNRRFAGGATLDLFTQGTAELITKPGRDLDTLAAFDAERARMGLGADLARFSGASAIAELALRFAPPHGEGDPALFAAMSGALDAIAAADPALAGEATLAGAWRLVAELGFAPVLDACNECHEEIAESAVAAFHHRAGGVLCERCARLTPGGRRLPSAARWALLGWVAGVGTALSAAETRAHQRLLREFLYEHLVEGGGRRLVAFEAWAEDALGGNGLATPRRAPGSAA